MIRWLGPSFVVVFAIGWASSAEAQMAAGRHGLDASAYADSPYQIEPYGGFGLETMQTPFVGTVVLDRFGIVRGIPPAQPARRASGPRQRGKASAALPRNRTAPATYRLPAGSLNWAGTSRMVLYSPALRYQNYGGGYGRGPYGSIDCGMMYKGMSLAH
jgi:hypothetical protein